MVVRVFDFFSGGGCFSTAASELEGVEAALGVDNWSVALSTYRRNHPGAAARGTTLPATWAALRLPPELPLDTDTHPRHTSPMRGAVFHRLLQKPRQSPLTFRPGCAHHVRSIRWQDVLATFALATAAVRHAW